MLTIVTIVDEDHPLELEKAQSLVGGFVELIQLPGGAQLLVNEEGLLRRLPINPLASYLARQPIVGNAVVLRGKSRWS